MKNEVNVQYLNWLIDKIKAWRQKAEKEGSFYIDITLRLGEVSTIIHALDVLAGNEVGIPDGVVIEEIDEQGNEKLADTESRSPYQATVAGMLSADYKERFKAEYQQTKIRYEKLKAFCNRIEAARHTMGSDSNKIEEPKHDCPFDLLRGQQRAMGEYLHILEIRAVIEGIEL